MPDISFHYLAKIDKALIQERQETLEKVAQRLYYEGMSIKDISKITKIDQKKLEQYLDVI